jgi:multidrug efflux system outer membrane protein
MGIKKYIALLFICIPGLISAQERSARVLTLEEACTLAEKNSIALQKQAIDLELDRVAAKNLWAQVFPSISVSGGARYNIPINSHAQMTDSYTASVGLSLRLNAGLPYTMANISLAYKNSLLNYEQARRLLQNQTSKNFFSLAAQMERVLFLEGAMRLALEQLERDRIARQSGYVGELDYLSAQVGAERAKLAYNRASADYQNDLVKFLSALGLDIGETVTLEGKPEIAKLTLDPDILILERLAQRPDIVAQHNEIERLKNARAGNFLSTKGPSVNLSADWGASLKNGFNDLISAGISVSIPIDPWIPKTTGDQAVKRSDANYQKALLDLQNLGDNAKQEIRSFTDSINNTWAEVEISRLQSSYAQRAYELAEQAYRRATMNFLDFETARNRLIDARQQFFQSELSYKILVLDLASALNMEEGELIKYSR